MHQTCASASIVANLEAPHASVCAANFARKLRSFHDEACHGISRDGEGAERTGAACIDDAPSNRQQRLRLLSTRQTSGFVPVSKLTRSVAYSIQSDRQTQRLTNSTPSPGPWPLNKSAFSSRRRRSRLGIKLGMRFCRDFYEIYFYIFN